jgi:glutamate/tyrosine decarboxylase-like PLP-dependent enzyme
MRSPEDRQALSWLVREALDFPEEVSALRVTTKASPSTLRAKIEARCDLEQPMPLDQALPFVRQLMRGFGVHATHPRHFGFFNPSVTTASVVGDALAALYNPQLAVWAHAPAACEIERFVLRALADRLGLDAGRTHANFTTGGAEANASALAVALTHRYPQIGEDGLVELGARPTLYRSTAAHESVDKAAHVAGLGRRAVRAVGTDARRRLDLGELSRAIDTDRTAGLDPLMVVGTAGTTTTGAVDPLEELADLCADQGLWLHVDGAWGASAALSPRLAPCLAGIERADSITWDAHKWLSVAMGAGMFFCRHPEAVYETFRVSTGYMPRSREDVRDAYVTTMQWSRRFIGLKVFLSLAEKGLPGWASIIERQAELAGTLRNMLRSAGWTIDNDTELPVVCFSHEALQDRPGALGRVASAIVRGGQAWISTAALGPDQTTLRACLTSYQTQPEDLERLLSELGDALHKELERR